MSKKGINLKLKLFYVLCLATTLVYEIKDFDWNENTNMIYDLLGKSSYMPSLEDEVIVDLINIIYQVLLPTLLIGVVLFILTKLLHELSRVLRNRKRGRL